MDSSKEKPTESPLLLLLNTKQRNHECAMLIKEQHQILRSEIEIKKILEDIDNHMNQLLVEEFQLKSYLNPINAAGCKSTTTPTDVNINTTITTTPKAELDATQINRQELNLMFQKPGNDMEEEEEEEEEEDDVD